MGSKITLNSSFTAATGKTLNDDAVLPLQGAILLVDAVHSLGGLGGSGVPAAGQTLPNIAWPQAAAMAGSGSQSTLSPVFQPGTNGTANCGIQRTPRGGLHVAASQDVQVNMNGYQFQLSGALRTLILNKKNDDVYLSLWSATTRVISNNQPGLPRASFTHASSPNANPIVMLKEQLGALDNDQPLSGGPRIGRRLSNTGLGGRFHNIASSESTGTVTNIADVLCSWGAAFSQYGGLIVATPAGAASWVFYRVYAEDLTVSGRSYAEVDALDYALYQREVLTVGGKYYGDTWTDPATLAGS